MGMSAAMMRKQLFRTGFIRFNSSCAGKFQPLIENYKVLRHIHFPGITPFLKGQKIQETIVNANLDFKDLESKIKKQKYLLESQGFAIPEYEDQLLKKILDIKPSPTVLTFEFENVYTGGKKVKKDRDIKQKMADFENMGCKFYQLERGGDITWHGQGQLVAYIILDLKSFLNLTVKCFVDSVLLKSVQNTLQKNYDLKTYTNENPGVWASEKDDKISSVGCNVLRAITSHGISLNVNPDLKFLNSFTMCGLPGSHATSIQALKPDQKLSVEDAASQYVKEVAQALGISRVEKMDGKELQV